MNVDLFAAVKSACIERLAKEKGFVASGFLFRDNRMLASASIPFKDENEKIVSLMVVGSLCVQHSADYLIVAIDSMMRKIPPKEMDYVLKNADTESPSMYPESMRDNVLVFYCVDFNDKSCPLNTVAWKYKKNEQAVVFIEEICMKSDGRNCEIVKNIADGIRLTLERMSRSN